MNVLSSALAMASFLLSFYTLWITQFRRGHLKMTRPTLLCLKREVPSGTPKIFMRTLLFTTASKTLVIENMYLKVYTDAGEFRFDFWGHTDSGKLTLGSGLSVGPTGVASDHHFNPRRGSEDFLFWVGNYRIEVFSTVVGEKQPIRLMEIEFLVNGTQAAELTQIFDRELFLYWNPEKHVYEGMVEQPPKTH